MQRPSIFLKTLRDLRWQVFWYGIGLALMAAFVVFIFPTYRDQLATFQIPDALKPLIGDVNYATGKGFLSAEFLSWTPLVLLVYAIMSGTSAILGEEANGTLDLLLAQPVPRRRLILEKLAGLLVASFLIIVLILGGWLISVPFVDLGVSFADLTVATFNMLPIVLFFQALSIWTGVALPARGLATGAVIGFAVASYFVNYVASLVDAIKPLREVSVFYHYHGTNVLADGVQWPGLLLLCALYVFFAAWSVYLFQRRDLGVIATRLHLRFWPSRSAPSAAS